MKFLLQDAISLAMITHVHFFNFLIRLYLIIYIRCLLLDLSYSVFSGDSPFLGMWIIILYMVAFVSYNFWGFQKSLTDLDVQVNVLARIYTGGAAPPETHSTLSVEVASAIFNHLWFNTHLFTHTFFLKT